MPFCCAQAAACAPSSSASNAMQYLIVASFERAYYCAIAGYQITN
jgi:hypothetical protein